MAEVDCTRCGERREGLGRAPLPGALGETVVRSTCAACWQGWLGEQVKLINETRVSPADPQGFGFLVARMRAWLNLPEGA